nr:hypothetical protein [Tanacetum cinerariifolium]
MADGHVDNEVQKVLEENRKEADYQWECRAPRSQDTKHKESTRRIVPVEIDASTALVSCDGLDGYDWSDQAEEAINGFYMSLLGAVCSGLANSLVLKIDIIHGLQVQQRPNGIFINQAKYVQEILHKFDLGSVRMATTHYEAPKPKSKNESDSPINIHLYRSMIGSLMYLPSSRPDIMFAVSACLRNQVTPTTLNLKAVKKIFKYLKGQPKLGLWYLRESPFMLEAYSDSDYAGANKDRKSTTGGCQFLGRRLISWQCKKQTIMATSSTKAAYVVAANYCVQALELHSV